MENVLSSAEYLARAEMHEGLAEATSDVQARQMHRAMAAEYRRRADQAARHEMTSPPSRGTIIEMAPPAASLSQPA